MLKQLEAQDRPASAEEQRVLARWSGWGAVPAIFDERRPQWEAARAQLRSLLTDREYASARRTTLNAHFTDAALVAAIWDFAGEMGFRDGEVLEPGCGSGNFVGLAPGGARVTGVEQDPMTAAVAGHLYPDAVILAESFAETRAPDGAFDLVVGNVPFGRVTLHDPTHNPGWHTIHNHFLVKSLHLTRPGGLVVAITSRYTLDGGNPAARREMAELADLLAAVRLPSDAHRRAAGTEVVTDVLILRRREPDAAPAGERWERTVPVEVASGVTVEMNEVLARHPEWVLGELRRGRGLYRDEELQVVGQGNAPTRLRQTLAQVAARAQREGMQFTERQGERIEQPLVMVEQLEQRPEGYVTARRDGSFTQVRQGVEVPFEVRGQQNAQELRQLLGMRDALVALLELEASSFENSAEMQQLRVELNRRYDRYVGQYGPINRFSWGRTGRVDPNTGEERMRRLLPNQGGFRQDTYAWVVRALEDFDPVSQSATKTAVMRERVVAPRARREATESPADALAICLDEHGEVRIDEVARLLRVGEVVAREMLGTLVFDEPGEEGRLVPAAEYLSGDVRAKRAQAQRVAEADPRWQVNVDALNAVVPRDLGPEEIDARMGAPWIAAPYVTQFLTEILEDATIRVEHPGGSTWTVKGLTSGVRATSTWGTERVAAPRLAEALLEQRQVTVYDTLNDDSRVLNLMETTAARQKADTLGERFSQWVWEDPERAAELAQRYNEQFNGLALRSYDGVSMALPGLSSAFEPRPHQVAAVARIISEPAVLLAHEVGAGKTAEMVIGSQELRRLGVANKPGFVVPNHMLEQFGRELLQIYPRARVLVADKDAMQGPERREFVARCATGDWDAVVLSRSAFERIPMSPEARQEYLESELRVIRQQLENSKEGGGLTVKRLERSLLQAQERIKKKLDSGKADVGVSFEMTGIDYLFIDEAHGYKNLRTPSNIQGASIDGSQRADDLAMKLHYLRRTRGKRVVTFATATPIANSVTEAYVIQRYLQPELLERAGVEDFDTWAANFGATSTEVEMSPAGNEYRLKTRFSKFRNVPELLRMLHTCADVKLGEDLALPTPEIEGGKAETVVVEPASELIEYIQRLGKRAEAVSQGGVDPTEDNMLKVSTDGRLAALDLRLVGNVQTEGQTKVGVAADRISQVWTEHREARFRATNGGWSEIPGALQLVFCDSGTPRQGWNVYDELRRALVERGVPREQIRFVHEARNDREKGELFAACRSGRVAVLIGSTERMGVGTNVQARAIALHHLDCPWRPADLAQRDGRILRQGNQNPEVRLLRYVTEGSFDTYMWQTVERKARFIGQVMRGRLDVREIEDIGDTALSYAEVKALAAGDTRLMDKARVDGTVARLERLQRSWDMKQWQLRRDAGRARAVMAGCEATIAQATEALERRQDTRGEAFRAELEGRIFTERPTFAKELNLVAERTAAGLAPGQRQDDAEIGRMGGFELIASVWRDSKGQPSVEFHLVGVPAGDVRIDGAAFGRGTGVVARLENRIMGVENVRAEAEEELARMRSELAKAESEIGQPFPQAQDLAEAREEAGRLDEELEKLAAQPAEGAEAGSTAGGAETIPSEAGSSAEPIPVDSTVVDRRAARARWVSASRLTSEHEAVPDQTPAPNRDRDETEPE